MMSDLQIYDPRERRLVAAADRGCRWRRRRRAVAADGAGRAPRRILLLRLERIGDLLMVLPAIADLARARARRRDRSGGRQLEPALARTIRASNGVERSTRRGSPAAASRAGLGRAAARGGSWRRRRLRSRHQLRARHPQQPAGRGAGRGSRAGYASGGGGGCSTGRSTTIPRAHHRQRPGPGGGGIRPAGARPGRAAATRLAADWLPDRRAGRRGAPARRTARGRAGGRARQRRPRHQAVARRPLRRGRARPRGRAAAPPSCSPAPRKTRRSSPRSRGAAADAA